jgi:hypothetical protein
LAHRAKIFPNSSHQKVFLARLHHHANFQQNRSTIERIINNFNFFSTPEEKNLEESGAEPVRDGPMVSLGKIMLVTSSFTMLNMRNIYFYCPTLNFIRSYTLSKYDLPWLIIFHFSTEKYIIKVDLCICYIYILHGTIFWRSFVKKSKKFLEKN